MIKLKTIKEIKELKGKRVLLRVDFNVPLDENGNIRDSFRIEKSLPTIKYLKRKKAKVILITHLGKPKGRKVEKLRLNNVQKKLSSYLDFKIKKLDDCIGEKVERKIKKMKEGDIILLENLRFHKGEENNDKNFTRLLAKLGDIYVNDAFSVCHRPHSSIVGLPYYLPAFSGFLLEKEVEVLTHISEKAKKPLVVIIGGAKVSSKITTINLFLKKGGIILIGGKVANIILGVRNDLKLRGKSLEKEAGVAKKIKLEEGKVYLPLDVVVKRRKNNSICIKNLSADKIKNINLIFDIGDQTIELFSKIIKKGRTIIWAGPLGLFEDSLFEKGTKIIGREIVKNKNAFKFAGGGDTSLALLKFGLRERFDFVSTGGGAMLAFLGGEKLPGLEILKK